MIQCWCKCRNRPGRAAFSILNGVVLLTLIVGGAPAAQADSDPEVKIESPVLHSTTQTEIPEEKTLIRGEAETVRYDISPATVIVGDANIVAATIVSSKILVLTGLQSGNTNVIVLNEGGRLIDRFLLRVRERGFTVVLRRGEKVELIECGSTCGAADKPTVLPATQSSPGSPASAQPAPSSR